MLGRPIIWLCEVGSTMDVLADLAMLGAPEGTAVVADHQFAGRGRAQRPWVALKGAALLHSVLLRPDVPVRRLMPLSILVGEALVATIRDDYSVPAQLKWPNDVLIRGRKVSGVLIQIRGTPPAVIVGVGVNVNVLEADLPAGGTSLLVELGEYIDRRAVMRTFLDRLEVRYRELLADDLECRWRRVDEVLAFRDELVTVQDGEAHAEGRVQGVDRDGALLLAVDGTTRRIVVGDVSRGPRPLGSRSE